ncbi:phage holin family protein [Crocosphaera sp. UHCC 0190]|uniref:phage holin family protein n=1 Tax=Crocosphaera sp. UHCC 0190 TaxID=3110246 RepID=UPI002B1F49F0|nr:phage holin family protein [Crocosphaera sp. UHCC 0190]MEA5510348.1 phage holin family protein [Crocosphaera sp. UHCC 0190]
MDLLIAWLVTAISLLIIAQLPIGVEVDDFWKALVAAIVFGILNALVKPVLVFLTIPLTIITLGLFLFVINAIVFGLAAALVQGFRLRYGFWSAMFGSVFLSIVNGLLMRVVGGVN